MGAVVTSAVANVLSEAAKGVFKEAKRHIEHGIKRNIEHVINSEKNVNKFTERVQTLRLKRKSVQQDVDDVERSAKRIKVEVKVWCDTVDKKIEEEAKNVKELEDKAEKKFFFGWCPNIKGRYQLSKKAEKGAKTVDELLQQAGQFSGVSCCDVAEDRVDGPPKDFEAFESRKKVFNDIMETLKDSTIGMIGVYGMAGVGKTTLVNEVGRQVNKDKLFDAVVMGVVNQAPDIQKIQNQIADSLGLKFEEQSIEGRARRLCERLKKEKNKKILVVLDDLWTGLDLGEVGIPFYPKRKKRSRTPY